MRGDFMKFPLEWLINIRKNELSIIELELSSINNKINNNNTLREKNTNLISKYKLDLYSCAETWKLQSIIRSIENCENSNSKLEEELKYLIKDRDMILVRYNDKHVEIKLLEKAKEKFLIKEKEIRSKKEESEINELSLIIRKDL